ncbi:MAG: hypothetical protein JW839_16010 [Candidatus Lokiarchaeota archaeon]|nr:hypothetical protein [Candidatus Lokiarchaeota archaeon]
MDKKGLQYYFNVLYFIAGELVLLAFGIPMSATPRIDEGFRIAILATGLVILAVTIARFAQRYHQKPTQPKLTVLFGLGFFTVAFGAKLLTTSFNMALTYDRYYYDMALYGVITSIYCFLLFGISMLITPFSEKPRSGLKVTTDVIFLAVFTLFFVVQLLSLLGAAGVVDDLVEVTPYVMLVVALYVMAILCVMAAKAFALARRADKEHHRRGMNALGTSFMLIVATVLLLLANNLVESGYNRALEIVTIGLAVVAFSFLYLGFVRPADVEKAATGAGAPRHAQ